MKLQKNTCSVVALSLALAFGQQEPDASPTFRSQSNLVVVNVFVRDKSGKPITGLKKTDFALTENGKPQEVAVFESQNLQSEKLTPIAPALATRPTARPTLATPDTPIPAGASRFRDKRLMVLFFDLSSMDPAEQIRSQKAAMKFITEQMTASDLVAIMSFGIKLKVEQEFTNDRELLTNVIRRFRVGEASDLAVDGNTDTSDATDDSADFSADESEFNIFNTDRKLSALEQAAKMLAPLPEKKALIYFSSGVSKTGAENESQIRSTVNAAVRANVSFYAVDVRGLVATPPAGDASATGARGNAIYRGGTQTSQRDKYHQQQETLTTLAADTGGKALLDNNDLAVGIQQAQDDMQSYYILGYYSTNTAPDGRYRRVQVKLTSNLQAKLDYRNGYFGAKEFKAFNANDKEKQLEEALALGDPLTELPLALEVNYFRLGKDRYFIPVAAKIPGSAIPLAKKGNKERTEFDFIGQVRDAKGQLAASVRDAVPIQLAETDAGKLTTKSLLYDTGFTLPAGQYSLKLLVRENQSGKMGTFETKFSVPDREPQKNQLLTSSVVWSNQREPLQAAVGSAEKQKKLLAQHPLVQDGQKLIPSITHVFRRDQNLYVYLEVYDPGTDEEQKRPSVAASVSLYQGKNKAFESAPVRLSQVNSGRPNTLPLQIQLPLKNLQPGKYVCQVNVVDELGQKFRFERTPLVLLP